MTQQAGIASEVRWKTATAVAAIAGIAVLASVMRWTQRDIRAAQRILAGLAAGKVSVTRAIHWEQLQAIDLDVGSTYAQLPNDIERRAYQQSFVANFAEGFRQAGGRMKAFRGWRIQSRQPERVVVAVDDTLRGKTLVLSLSASAPKRLEGVQWQ